MNLEVYSNSSTVPVSAPGFPTILYTNAAEFEFRQISQSGHPSAEVPRYLSRLTCIRIGIHSPYTIEIGHIIERSAYSLVESAIFYVHLHTSVSTPGVVRLLQQMPTFRRFAALLVLVQGPQWFLYCYFCPAENSVSLLGVRVETEIDKIHSDLNAANGHGHPIVLSSSTPLEVTKMRHHECRAEVYNNRPPSCHTSHVMLEILGTKLNMFDLNVEVDHHLDKDRDFDGGLHICILCSGRLEDLANYAGKLFTYDRTEVKLTYCYRQGRFKEPSWSILSDPFDVWIWSGVGLTVTVFSFLNRQVIYSNS